MKNIESFGKKRSKESIKHKNKFKIRRVWNIHSRTETDLGIGKGQTKHREEIIQGSEWKVNSAIVQPIGGSSCNKMWRT